MEQPKPGEVWMTPQLVQMCDDVNDAWESFARLEPSDRTGTPVTLDIQDRDGKSWLVIDITGSQEKFEVEVDEAEVSGDSIHFKKIDSGSRRSILAALKKEYEAMTNYLSTIDYDIEPEVNKMYFDEPYIQERKGASNFTVTFDYMDTSTRFVIRVRKIIETGQK